MSNIIKLNKKQPSTVISVEVTETRHDTYIEIFFTNRVGQRWQSPISIAEDMPLEQVIEQFEDAVAVMRAHSGLLKKEV